MSCPSAMTCALYADGALAPEDAAAIELHTTDCADCRERVAVLAGENRTLRAAFRVAEARGEVPAFAPSASLAPLLSWVVIAALGTTLAWSTLTTTELPRWLQWWAPDLVGMGIDLAVAVMRHLLSGEPLLTTGAYLTGLALLVVAAAAWLLTRRHAQRAAPLCVSLCMATLLMTNPSPSEAFEVRRAEDRVTIPADETIDDTLIIMADSVLVEGTVTGDLIALGERVTVRGRVGGTLVAVAEELKISGQVGDTVLALGESVEFWRAALGANAYSAGRTVTVSADTTVAGSAALAAEHAEVYGRIGRDLLAAAKGVSLAGSVGGDFTAYAERADLDAAARVAGDLTAKLRGTDDLSVSPDASVGGETNLSTWPEDPNRYLTLGFYIREALQLLAAFLTGLVLFLLVPRLREARLERSADVLVTAAVGAVALFAVPALALVTIVTLIGAPLGIIALLAWVAALYAAGIVTAALLGRRLLNGDDPRDVLRLLVGLAIVFVLINLPFVGGIMRLLVILLGLGVIAQWLRGLWVGRPA